MSGGKIRWLIGILSIAMLGLIIFQFYWIRQVTEVNKERFSQSVQAALNEVANKLARENDVDFLQSDINRIMPLPMRENRLKGDSLSENGYNRTEENPQNYQGAPPFMSRQFIRMHYDESTQDMMVTFDFQAFSSQADDFFNQQNPNSEEQGLRLERQMNQRIKDIQREWVNHLMGDESLFSRIDPFRMDTLLNNELQNRGIDLPFNYGIVQRKTGETSYINTNNVEDKDKIVASPLQANLFPMDIIPKDYYLSIYFPSQKKFLLKQGLLPLTASGLLMLIVIFCFAYAIMIILRQKKISEVKNDFINNMTHEFKTPIATVSLATEALQDDDLKKNPGIVDRYVQVIRDENKRLGMQVEKVLQIASLDKKDFHLKFENADIHDIIEKALVNINIMVESRQGSITSQLLASNPIIEADKVHLTNIIYNLLDNANKYSPEHPEIHIRTENISTGVIIKISDKGIGMTKEAIEKIFEKFYRVSTGNIHDIKGFGLGLSYVKNIVEMHKGTVSVKSELGKGSTFKVYLPFTHG